MRLIGLSVAAERGDLAFVADRAGSPRWVAPRAPRKVLEQVERAGDEREFTAGPRSLDRCLRLLVEHAPSFPAGTFVFVLSDFVEAVVPRMWRRLRALHWDVTPVVIQDPTWEQSFPDVGGVLLPVGDVETGDVRDVWIRRSDARARAAANERRLDDLVTGFRHLGFDPVLLGSSDPGEIARCFGHWSERGRGCAGEAREAPGRPRCDPRARGRSGCRRARRRSFACPSHRMHRGSATR